MRRKKVRNRKILYENNIRSPYLTTTCSLFEIMTLLNEWHLRSLHKHTAIAVPWQSDDQNSGIGQPIHIYDCRMHFIFPTYLPLSLPFWLPGTLTPCTLPPLSSCAMLSALHLHCKGPGWVCLIRWEEEEDEGHFGHRGLCTCSYPGNSHSWPKCACKVPQKLLVHPSHSGSSHPQPSCAIAVWLLSCGHLAGFLWAA